MSKPRQKGSDADLKAIAATSPQYAMDLVVQRYRDRLTWHALCIVKERQEAADAVQDVFIKAMRETRFWDPEFEIRAWLFRVTTNLCYNIVRDKKRRSGILAAMPEEQVPQGRTRATRDHVQGQQMRKGMLQAIDQLTPKHREILLLRYYNDLSYREIAAALEIKLGTVMSRLSRARDSLGRVLGPEHPLVAEAR